MEHLSTVELVEKPSRTSSSSLPFALPEKRGVDSFSFVTSSRNTQDDTSSFDSFILRTSADYSKPKWILLPDDNIRRAWELLIVFILIYIAIAVPIRMAFLISESDAWLAVDLVVDILFLMDIIFNLFFFAYKKWNGKIVVSQKRIMFKYLKSWFIVDLIATIPFYLFLHSSTLTELGTVNNLFRIFRFSRVITMTKLLRLIKISADKPNFFRKTQEFLSVHALLSKLLWFFMWAFLAIHLSACIWIFVAGINFHQGGTENWLNSYFGIQSSEEFKQMDRGTIYLTGIYWSIMLFSTVGLGDIVARNNVERGVSLATMVIGASFYAFVVSSVSTALASLDAEQVKRKKKFDSFEQFISQNNLKPELVARIRRYLMKKPFQEIKTTDFLSQIPPRLRYEVISDVHKNIKDKIPFLKDKSLEFSTNFLEALRPIIFEGNQTVAERGDSIDELYFLIRGVIEVRDPLSGRILETLKEGSYFGEQALFGGRYTYTYHTLEECQLYFISKKALKSFAESYPEISLLLKIKSRSQTQYQESRSNTIEEVLIQLKEFRSQMDRLEKKLEDVEARMN